MAGAAAAGTAERVRRTRVGGVTGGGKGCCGSDPIFRGAELGVDTVSCGEGGSGSEATASFVGTIAGLGGGKVVLGGGR